MINSNVAQIKRSQKESLLLREFSKMIHKLSLDIDELSGLFINRVELSRDKGTCHVFFYHTDGIKVFQKKMATLILYKPSLRKNLAATLQSRYVPEIKFLFDSKFEKQLRVDNIINVIKKEFKDEEE